MFELKTNAELYPSINKYLQWYIIQMPYFYQTLLYL